MWDFVALGIRLLRRLPEKTRRVCARGFLRAGDTCHRVAEGVLWSGLGDLHPKHRLTRYHDWFVSRVSPEDVVIDLGCGNGALAYDLAGVAGEVMGVDISRESIEEARARYSRPHLTFAVADATDFDPDPRFTCAVLSNVVEHIDDRVSLLRRLGKTGMRILMRVPARDRSWWVPAREELGLDSRLDPTHKMEYTAETLRQELAESGLVVVESERMWSEFYVEARAPKGYSLEGKKT